LGDLTHAERLLYIGLWCYADKEGLFEWIPKKIEACIFPYDKGLKVDKMLCNLMSLHFIVQYNTSLGWIPKFKDHQNPHPNEAKSKLPPPGQEVIDKWMSLQCNVITCKCHADIRIPDTMNPDINAPKKTPLKNMVGKEKYGDTVLLSKDEYESLAEKYTVPVLERYITELDTYQKNNKPYKDHKATIRNWIEKAIFEGKLKIVTDPYSAIKDQELKNKLQLEEYKKSKEANNDTNTIL
jgi:hypothetical protein